MLLIYVHQTEIESVSAKVVSHLAWSVVSFYCDGDKRAAHFYVVSHAYAKQIKHIRLTNRM